MALAEISLEHSFLKSLQHIDISFLSLCEFFLKDSILSAIKYRSSTATEILVILTALQNNFFLK